MIYFRTTNILNCNMEFTISSMKIIVNLINIKVTDLFIVLTNIRIKTSCNPPIDQLNIFFYLKQQ